MTWLTKASTEDKTNIGKRPNKRAERKALKQNNNKARMKLQKLSFSGLLTYLLHFVN